MTSPTGKQDRRGFTLVEVLIAVVILASGAVVVSQALAQLARGLALARQQSIVYDFAAAKMAEVAHDCLYAQPPDKEVDGSFQHGDQWYRWSVLAAEEADHPERRLVELTVVWNAAGQTQARRYAQRAAVRVEHETP